MRRLRAGRELRRITADDILRAAGTAADLDCTPITGSALLNSVVMRALGQAEHAFSAALARINVEDLARSAAALQNSSGPHDLHLSRHREEGDRESKNNPNVKAHVRNP